MLKNDMLYKILFAIELALLPLVFFANISLAENLPWATAIFIGAILVAKFWMEIFKDRNKFTHNIISAIGNIIVFSVLIIFFIATERLNMLLGVFAIFFIIAFEVISTLMHKYTFASLITSFDYCHMMFGFVVLLGMCLITVSTITLNVGVIAMLLTGIVSVGYKVYYAFRYTDFLKFFKHKK